MWRMVSLEKLGLKTRDLQKSYHIHRGEKRFSTARKLKRTKSVAMTSFSWQWHIAMCCNPENLRNKLRQRNIQGKVRQKVCSTVEQETDDRARGES